MLRLLLLLSLSLPGPVQRPAAPRGAEARGDSLRTRVVLLGTGTPNATPDRWGPALAVVVDSSAYLVDAGPGVVRRAAAAAARGTRGLEAPRLRIVFLTHLHSDHTLGLPDLVFSPWTLGRREPLLVVGPPGTAGMVRHIQEAYREDVAARVYGAEPANVTGYRVEVREVEPGEVYRDERVVVTAFQVAHGSWPFAFGYRFETPDRTVVVSGDTAPTEAVVEACRGCDVLVHEVFSEEGLRRRSPEWQRYHRAFHTSGPDLGRLAARARPGLLVLTHQLLWGATSGSLLAEVRSEFRGRVVFGRDLDVF